MTRTPSSRLLDFLSRCDPGVVEIALALREVVLEEAPDAVEKAYDVRYAVSNEFSTTGKMKDSVCHVVSYLHHVGLGFNAGTSLPDPDKLLTGTGKAHRHVRINSLKDARRAQVRRLIRAALEQALRS